MSATPVDFAMAGMPLLANLRIKDEKHTLTEEEHLCKLELARMIAAVSRRIRINLEETPRGDTEPTAPGVA